MEHRSRSSRSHRGIVIAGCLTLTAVWTAQPASGIPAFARKYETSCQTCHTVYPKLNPFGNAFRLSGYHMPGETEEMVKQEPVRLGSDANKRLWPNALWPSTIPAHVPLSIDLRLAAVTEHDAAENETRSGDFRFPESLELLAGGTFGDDVSYFAALEAEVENEPGVSEVEIEIGHAEVHFNGPWGTGHAFNLKLGRFTPEMSQQFSHGYLATDSVPAVMFGFNPIGPHGSSEVGGGDHHGGPGGISLPGGIDGLEVYGIVGHRFDYSVGIANGIGPGDGFGDGNDAKDYFARVGYKLGGMPLDGGDDYQGAPENWRETSLRVGVFAYQGDGGDLFFAGTGHHSDEVVEDRDFDRWGIDLNAYVGDVNLIFGYVQGDDRLAVYEIEAEEDEHGEGEPAEDDHGSAGELHLESIGDFEYEAWFGEADVVIKPWLHGAVRYEWLAPSRANRDDFERVVLDVIALVRANVKLLLEYRENLGGDTEDDYELRALLRVAF